MFDGFERNNDVDGGVGQRQIGAGALEKTHTGTFAVSSVRVRDRRCVDIDTDDGRRRLAQQGSAVTLAAGRVKDALASDEATRERIAMPMLVGDFASAAGKEALAGECEVSHCAGRRQASCGFWGAAANVRFYPIGQASHFGRDADGSLVGIERNARYSALPSGRA